MEEGGFSPDYGYPPRFFIYILARLSTIVLVLSAPVHRNMSATAGAYYTPFVSLRRAHGCALVLLDSGRAVASSAPTTPLPTNFGLLLVGQYVFEPFLSGASVTKSGERGKIRDNPETPSNSTSRSAALLQPLQRTNCK